MMIDDIGARIPGDRVTDTYEAAARGFEMLGKHRLNRTSETEIREADNAGDDWSTDHRGQLGFLLDDELSFAHRRHLAWAACAIGRVTLDKYCVDDVVTVIDIGGEIRGEVAIVREVPQKVRDIAFRP